jgi:prepilin-type processing-associated H-X9-DG protein
MNRPRHAFKLVELLVIIGILALLIAIVVPTIVRLRQEGRRPRCPSNLRQIGQAIMLYYRMENKGQFPRTTYSPGRPPTWGTGALSANPFTGTGRPVDNDVTAALFLLIRTQGLTSSAFVCDSTDTTDDQYGGGTNTALNRSNFTDWRKNLSYSLAVPYVNMDDKAWKDRLSGDVQFALAADMNPGIGDGFDVTAVNESSKSADMQKANSRNHQGVGQNVLFADGHVEFTSNLLRRKERQHLYGLGGDGWRCHEQ